VYIPEKSSDFEALREEPESMFTGLIQDVGTISRIDISSREARITVTTKLEQLELGESIAVSGACLTVTEAAVGQFTAFASEETLSRTGIGRLRARAKVNLERAVRVGDRLGGHLVTGHVDARVELKSRTPAGDAERFAVALPADRALDKQLAPKGSVAIDGVSLTINQVHADHFELMLIPLTLDSTTLAAAEPGSLLNLETDVLAKYVARQLDPNVAGDGVTLELLARSGFVR
jgi:riboflavin synthase